MRATPSTPTISPWLAETASPGCSTEGEQAFVGECEGWEGGVLFFVLLLVSKFREAACSTSLFVFRVIDETKEGMGLTRLITASKNRQGVPSLRSAEHAGPPWVGEGGEGGGRARAGAGNCDSLPKSPV